MLLATLERVAGLARRVGLGPLVDRAAPAVGRAAALREVEVDGIRLAGNHVGQLWYLRELAEGRERLLVELIRELTPRGGTAAEAGAHIGYVTCELARAVGPGGRVFAFEPDPDVLPALRANLERNGLEGRVTVSTAALGAGTGRARFHVAGGGETSSLAPVADARSVVEVEVVALDDALPAGARVDVVKLDIEGGETAALDGMRRVLGQASALFVECNPDALAAAGSSADELVARLREAGFEIRRIDEERGGLSPELAAFSGYANLVCARGEAAARLTA